MINFNPVSLARFNNGLTAQKAPKSNPLGQIQYDSVSFSGNKKPVKNDENKLTDAKLKNMPHVKAAANLSKKITTHNDLSLEGLQEAFNRTSPVDIDVYDIKDKPDYLPIPKNTIAHMLPLYSPENMELIGANIFLNPNFKTNEEKTTLFADSLHEYTHVLQRSEDKTYYGMKNELNNIEDIQTVARIAQSILNQLVNTLGSNISQSFMFQKAMQNGKYQFSSEEVEKYCAKDRPAKETAEEIVNSNIAILYNMQQTDIDRETFTKLVKGFIKQESLNEAEAYTVTLDTLKRGSYYDRTIYAKRNLNQGIYTAIYNSIN